MIGQEGQIERSGSTHVLIEALSVASFAAVSYVSTNLDNLVLLSAYGAKPGTRPLFVKLTFVFVCFVVLLVSLARGAPPIVFQPWTSVT